MRQEDIVDSVTVDAIIYNPGGSHLGAFPGPLLSANHHILDVYTWAYDPKRPQVCFDERPKQLVGEIRKPIPLVPGKLARYDYEYKRNGVTNIFMMFEPLAGKRYVKVTDRRTKKDWAKCMRQLADEIYPDAEQIVLVMDNLNTHTKASLYEAFEPAEAKRIADKLEIHYATIDSGSEAHDITDDWNGPDGSYLDVFVVRSMNGVDGWSAVDGPCSKDDKDEMTGSVVSLNGSYDNSGNTFAHKIGHYLGLEHISNANNFIGNNGASNANICPNTIFRL